MKAPPLRVLPAKAPAKSFKATAPGDVQSLRDLAFEHTAQPALIFNIKTGKIIVANMAACKLLGYTAKQILLKTRSEVFADNDVSFRKMLLRRRAAGQARAKVNGILKNGQLFPCEITSSIFRNAGGNETSITTITDLRSSIAYQEKEDLIKEKLVQENIGIALFESEKLAIQTSRWLKYFSQTSYDVMWDWNIRTGTIYVGGSVQSVFGFNLSGDTIDYEDFLSCLPVNTRKLFKARMDKILLSRKKTWEDSFPIRCENGQLASTVSRACIVRDNGGVAIRLIGATQDVSKLLSLEGELNVKNKIHQEDIKRFQLTAKLSFDVIWEWDLSTNELYIGEGFKELFGYSIRRNRGDMIKDWVNYLHPDDKATITLALSKAIKSRATLWKHAYRIIRADGSLAKVFVRASILRDASGRAYRMIGAIQDLTKQNELKAQLDAQTKNYTHLEESYKQNFKLIFNSTSDILYDVDLISDSVVLSDAYQKEFGYEVTENTITGDEWSSRIHPEDKQKLLSDFTEMLLTGASDWKVAYRYLRADNTPVSISGNAIVLRRANGLPYRVIGSMQDTHKKHRIESDLAAEISERESAMASAIEEARVAERSEIGKELHDNVNQLLGASKLYLEMAKRGGKNSKMFLDRSAEYTLTAIQEIRNLTKGLTSDTIGILGLCGSIDNMAADIMEVQPLDIILTLDTSVEYDLTTKAKINFFRIVQEQLNNIIKHAQAARVTITLARLPHETVMIVTDDGRGFDVSRTAEGIGLSNIAERVKVIGATSEMTSEVGKGTTLTVKLHDKSKA